MLASEFIYDNAKDVVKKFPYESYISVADKYLTFRRR